LDTLYVETNFLVGVATGRDVAASLLDDPAPPVRLVIPGICFLEALAWMEGDARRRRESGRQWRDQIKQLDRDLTSPFARNLRTHLAQAINENDWLSTDVSNRLYRAISALSTRALILNITAEVLGASRGDVLIGESTDNLILHAILDHARSTPAARKGFFSENKNDFDGQPAQDALRAAGVEYFRRAEAAIGWVGSPAVDQGP
jgi:hypothetical protein